MAIDRRGSVRSPRPALSVTWPLAALTFSSRQLQSPPAAVPANTCPESVVSQARSGEGKDTDVNVALSAAPGGLIGWKSPLGRRTMTTRASPATIADPSGATAAARSVRVAPQVAAPVAH